jgi:hypothetical protein
VQIGACYFDRKTGEIGETFLIDIDADSSARAGFKFDASTVFWWLQQSDETRRSVFGSELSRTDVREAINEFNSFSKKAKAIWSHATFDFVIIMNHFDRLNIKPNFHYRAARDLRTLTDLANLQREDFEKYKRVGVHHNALDDCIYQVKYAVDCLNKIQQKGV